MNTKKFISFIDERIEYYSDGDEDNLNAQIIEELENIRNYVVVNG